MKAIYINLDPYLQAVADWLNAGKPGTAPSFNPLPLAVTIPLGESAVVFIPRSSEGAEAAYLVDGQIVLSNCNVDTTDGANVASDINPGLSSFGAPPDEGYSQLYCARAVTGDVNITFEIEDFETTVITSFTIPVLVRRETASGPVDLVDFTPPAAAIAAGTDLKGTKFDGNEIVADESTGALSAPAGA